MPLSPEELARRRVANQAEFRAAKKARARTPIERVSAAWDHWRALLSELPVDQQGPWADVITNTLDANIDQLTKTINARKGERR